MYNIPVHYKDNVLTFGKNDQLLRQPFFRFSGIFRASLTFTILLYFFAYSFGQGIKVKVVENDPIATPLAGATVILSPINQGAVTNILGKIQLDGLPTGKYELQVTYVGYIKKTVPIDVPKDSDMVVRLDKDTTLLHEVVISATSDPTLETLNSVGQIALNETELKYMPRMLGEPDLIRALQNVPGVKTDTDYTGGFSVRGGKNDQNLILLDGVPMYNPWHLFGIFSAFNAEAVSNVSLMKGAFPARYGGRSSSVLDIELIDAIYSAREGSLNISPLSASLHYGIPINQNNSVMIAARRTYMEPFLLLMNEMMSNEGSTSIESKTKYHFTDANVKVVSKVNEKSNLSTSLLFSNDSFKDFSTYTSEGPSTEYIDEELGVKWQSISGSMKYNSFLNNNWAIANQLYLTNYQVQNEQTTNGYPSGINHVNEDYYNQIFAQNLLDIGYDLNVEKSIGSNHMINFGLQITGHAFEEENSSRETEIREVSQPGFTYDTLVTLNRSSSFIKLEKPVELAVHLSYNLSINHWSMALGGRLHYWNQGKYLDILPRVNVSYQLTSNWKLTAGYGHNTQYLQSLSLDFMRLPSEQWFWASETIRPLRSQIATIGSEYWLTNSISLAVEAYYKESQGLFNYSPLQQASFLDSDSDAILPSFTNEFVVGDGEAYGAEFLIRKKTGKMTGWIGYTLSWTWNYFDEMNQGDRFPSRTDRRHDLQTYLMYDLSKNWTFSVVFNLRSGQPITYSTNYTVPVIDPLSVNDFGGGEQVVTKYNNFRLPDYHRMDLALVWKNRKLFKQRSELTLSVINVYNRKNALYFSSNTRINHLDNGSIEVTPRNSSVSQLPILPMISIRIGLGKENRWKDQ